MVLKIIFNESIDNYPKIPLTKLLTLLANKPSCPSKLATITHSTPKQFITCHPCLQTNIIQIN